MLNTDMELAYNIDVDKLKGTKCVIGNHGPGNPCARSDSFERVEAYAKVSKSVIHVGEMNKKLRQVHKNCVSEWALVVERLQSGHRQAHLPW